MSTKAKNEKTKLCKNQLFDQLIVICNLCSKFHPQVDFDHFVSSRGEGSNDLESRVPVREKSHLVDFKTEKQASKALQKTDFGHFRKNAYHMQHM